MKIFYVLFLLVIMTAALAAKAQENYVFECSKTQYPKVNHYMQEGYFSDSVCFKLALFDMIYTKKIDKDSKKYIHSTEISKPDLYYSIQRLSKYYFKGLKKGIISSEKAENEFASILDKCMQIYPNDTAIIEAKLRETSNPQEIVGIFDKIIIKRTY